MNKGFFSAHFWLLLIGAIQLTGCSVGPDFKEQQVWTPAKWLKAQAGTEQNTVASETITDTPNPAWWDSFNDPVLSNLERRVASSNLDVQMATQRLAISRAQLLVAGAGRYPSIGAVGNYSYQQFSQKLVNRAINDVSLNSNNPLASNLNLGNVDVPPMNIWNDGIDASWEADLWGRVRRQTESAHALWQASEEDRRGVLIAQLAEVARDYIVLRGAQSKLDIVKENQNIAQKTLNLARQRFSGGLVTELDVQTAQAQLDQTTTAISQLEQQVAEQINALSLLLGEPPRALKGELSQAKPVPPVPPQVPIGIPSQLARRRPDIREAEAQLHAATADVGVAVADFYPKVTVNALFGFQSLSFRDLGFWQAKAWDIGPSISLPIFQGGKLKGQLVLKKAQQKEAAIAYQKTVLQAWRDVDNALTAYRAEQLRRQELEKTVKANKRSLYLAQEQYREGLQNFINVLDAESRLLDSQRSLTDNITQISVNLVQLYTALGGGWENTFPNHS